MDNYSKGNKVVVKGQNKQSFHKLLFVCGFPSGGTDLLKTILNAHPEIYINGEMPFLRYIDDWGYSSDSRFFTLAELELLQSRLKKLDNWRNIENLNHKFKLRIDDNFFVTLEDALYLLFTEKPRKIWGNKTPQNTENIDVLNRIFPSAKFLIITRDVRDVCLSWENKWGRDMLLCAAKWAERMQKGFIQAQKLDNRQSLIIKFEDLLNNTEYVCAQICEFLDILFATTMLKHHNHVVKPVDGKINYGQAIIKNNQQKWRSHLPPYSIKRIEEIGWDTMTLFDYHPDYATNHVPVSSFEKTRGKVRDVWAMLFIGNRASKDNSFAKRLSMVAFEFKKRSLRVR
jgi:hypothetical protein